MKIAIARQRCIIMTVQPHPYLHSLHDVYFSYILKVHAKFDNKLQASNH